MLELEVKVQGEDGAGRGAGAGMPAAVDDSEACSALHPTLGVHGCRLGGWSCWDGPGRDAGGLDQGGGGKPGPFCVRVCDRNSLSR